jgi:hypothetical protein
MPFVTFFAKDEFHDHNKGYTAKAHHEQNFVRDKLGGVHRIFRQFKILILA